MTRLPYVLTTPITVIVKETIRAGMKRPMEQRSARIVRTARLVEVIMAKVHQAVTGAIAAAITME